MRLGGTQATYWGAPQELFFPLSTFLYRNKLPDKTEMLTHSLGNGFCSLS